MLKWVARAVGMFGVGLGVAVLIATQLLGPQEPQDLMWIKWGGSPTWDNEFYEEVEDADHVMLSPGVWENGYDRQAIMVSKDVDKEFGTYFSMHTCPYWMQRASLDRYPGKLWAALSTDLAVTTEGDTASIWKNQPVYDIFKPEVRRRAAILLGNYCRESGVTTVFLDYCTVPLIRYDQPPEGVHGELDFDRDGIGHSEDIDEQLRLRVIWDLYIAELRAELPQGTHLTVNGRLAVVDPEFTVLVDKVYLEHFPRYFWGSVNENWANALNPEYPNNIHEIKARGVDVVLGSEGSWNEKVYMTAKEFEMWYGPAK